MAFDIKPAPTRLAVRTQIAIVPPRMINWKVNASSVLRQSPPIEEPFPFFVKIRKNRRLFCDESGVGCDDGEGVESGLLLLLVVVVNGSGLGDDVSFSSRDVRSAGCRDGSDVVGLELLES